MTRVRMRLKLWGGCLALSANQIIACSRKPNSWRAWLWLVCITRHKNAAFKQHDCSSDGEWAVNSAPHTDGTRRQSVIKTNRPPPLSPESEYSHVCKRARTHTLPLLLLIHWLNLHKHSAFYLQGRLRMNNFPEKWWTTRRLCVAVRSPSL